MKKIEKREELIQEYINFFKGNGHKEIPNMPLVPENDPTVLFTTAGMHPLVPFLLGARHPSGKRLVNCQRCIRTGDIDSVGDEFHLTFFEMLGNWSLGDYFKKEAIDYSFDFLTKVLQIPISMLAVTCFKGDKDAPKDTESAMIWKTLGIKDERISFMPKENNWWGPAGKTGPCGPDSEMFFYVGKGEPHGNALQNENDWSEIWNDVFMQYNQREDKTCFELKQKNVDTGMGVERVIAVLNGKKSVYDTNLFMPIIKKIEKISGKKYNWTERETRSMRIIADHAKASCMILAEKIVPSNVEHGYVLRRLIRMAVRHARLLGIEGNFLEDLAEEIFKIYPDYILLNKNKLFILDELAKEEERFESLLSHGIRYFEKISKNAGKIISGKDAFLLYQSYGFPIEMTRELASEKGFKINEQEYEQECKNHQELSRTASAGAFKSGLADNSKQTMKLHTATHMLNEALRRIVDPKISQKGSNITPERLRFDFNFDRKLADDELKKVEALVNEKIKEKLDVRKEEVTLEEARKRGAQAQFEGKYGEKVFLYSIGNFSVEVCSGPHVKNTFELGKFKIIKEESSAAGIRRIKAVLE